MKPTEPSSTFLATCGHRIVAVTPGAPRTLVDSVAGEVGILIGELCKTTEEAERLTQQLVDEPQPRWNFAALRAQAQRLMAPPAAPAPTKPPNWYGFEIPEWAWQPNRWGEFEEVIDRELWRRVESWTPQHRQQLETKIRANLADYQARNPTGPFENPSPAQIRHYMIVAAGRENEIARLDLEPEPWNPIALRELDRIQDEKKAEKLRPKTKRR